MCRPWSLGKATPSRKGTMFCRRQWQRQWQWSAAYVNYSVPGMLWFAEKASVVVRRRRRNSREEGAVQKASIVVAVVVQKVVAKQTHLKVVLDTVHLVIASRKPRSAIICRADHHVERIPMCALICGHECADSSSGVNQPVRGGEKNAGQQRKPIAIYQDEMR